MGEQSPKHDISLEDLYNSILESSVCEETTKTHPMSGIKPPKQLVVNNELDMAQEWLEWIELYDHYFTANKLNSEDAPVQAANLLASLGRDVIKVLNNLGITTAEKKDIAKIKEKLAKHFAPSRNKTYERCMFHRIKQQEHESFADFLQKLQSQVKKCAYSTNEEEFTMDQIVLGVHSETTRQKLWTEDILTYEKAVKICRAEDTAVRQIHDVQEASSSSVSAIKNDTTKDYYCKRCLSRHAYRECQTFQNPCKQCGRLGHLSENCRSKSKGNSAADKESKSKFPSKVKELYRKSKSGKMKKVYFLEQSSAESSSGSDSESEDYEYSVGQIKTDLQVNTLGDDSKWSEELVIGKRTIKVKLDTGAECNVLSKKDAKKLDLSIRRTTTKRILTYNNSTVPVIGEALVFCESQKKTAKPAMVAFKIVDGHFNPILGRKMCEQMGFIVRVDNVTTEVDKALPVLGCCKNFIYDIDFIENPNFKIIPPRRIPHAIRNRVKEELDQMVKLKVITPVSDPSPAVSPLLVIQKGDKIRVCMDPTELNKNVKRRHYPLKTLEEVAAKVHGSKFFTKLDCNKGFWQIPVTNRTSNYLAFSTPWGRYKYLRLPFGLSSSPEVFSENITKTLEGIENCESACDDMLLHASTLAELQTRTKDAIQRLTEAGFTLNMEKCEFEKERVKFLGHVFSAQGYEADKDKIAAIQHLKPPTKVKELQRLLGMVTYLSKFIPNLSEITEPLRILLHKTSEWHWDVEQQQAFENVKKVLTTAPVLGYYDVNDEIKLSVDASSKSLGVCMMQCGRPIGYASKSMNAAQQNYPQIEKEALAIRFGCTKFREYIYGKKLEIETDHKPLETIFKKPIQNTPTRLQRILWDVVQYAPSVKYIKGSQIPIADALSRDCDQSEDDIDAEAGLEEYKILALVTMSEPTLKHFAELTKEDSELQQLREVILRGWPAESKNVPEAVRKYENFREELSYEDGILYKASKLIVPKREVLNVLKSIHNGHPGIISSLSRARQHFYWYGQSQDIKNYVESCPICQQTQKSKQPEPLLQKLIPEYPFQLVSSDIFYFKGTEYLLMADHYSGFMDFKELPASTSAETIIIMKEWFAVHGIPQTLETDGGSQFKSKKFADFRDRWTFKHQISSPRYPKSNGFAERNVQTAKGLLKRCWLDGSDIYEGLLMLRNTNRNDILKSPAQRLFSRATRTFLPMESKLLSPRVVPGVTDELRKLRLIQKSYADRIASPFLQLQVNDKVRLQQGHRDWIPATVTEQTKYPRSVMVETNDGRTYRRNTHHLRRDKTTRSSSVLHSRTPTTDTNDSSPQEVIETEPAEAITQSTIVTEPTVTRSGRISKPPARLNYKELGSN